MKLSLCMIVKDEQGSLGRCLESVSSLVDEMIVVDTGSTDTTVSVAKEYGAKVIMDPWQNDFSKARNRSLEEARGDWILVLDADEEFCAEDIQKVGPLLDDAETKAYLIPIVNRSVHDKNPAHAFTHRNPRLFRNDPNYRFEGVIHEEIDLEDDKGLIVREAPVRIFHYDYNDASAEKKEGRRRRNQELLAKALAADPENATLNYYAAGPEMEEGRWSEALGRYKLSRANFPAQGYLQPVIAQNIISCLIELDRLDEAMAEVDSALRAFPNYSEFHYFAGEIFAKNNQYERALASFKTCVEQKDLPAVRSEETRFHDDAVFGIGVSSMVLGLRDRAIEAFAECLKLNPDDAPAREYLKRLK